MQHIIVSRMRFSDKSLLRDYLKITKKILIPSLKSQINQNFTWALLIYPEDIEFVKKYLDYDFISFSNYYEYFDYIKTNNVEIQTRHDIDDFMLNTYVEKIQNIYNENHEKLDTFLIQFQPIKLDLRTGKEIRMKKYTNENTSMFLTICQKNIQYSIHEKYFHGQMGQLTNNIITINDTYVKWVIHGKNISCNVRR